MKLVDARKVISELNETNNDEELVYELERYKVEPPKVMKTVWVTDEDCPNLKVPIRKKI